MLCRRLSHILNNSDGLQKSMDALQSFCDGFKLEVNYKKTKCMTFTKGNHTEKLTFKLKNTNIENVKEFKYLGVITKQKELLIPT